MDNTDSFVIGLAVGAVLFLIFGTCIGDCTATRSMENQAIELGYGRIVLNGRSAEFQWCPTPTMQPEQAARAAGRASE